MRKILVLFVFVVITVSLSAQEVNIIPKPAFMGFIKSQKAFTINSNTRIVIKNDSVMNAANSLNDYLTKYLSP